MGKNKSGGRGFKGNPLERANKSFQDRYGMTRSEWTHLKKELRAEGNGKEIDRMRREAYAKIKFSLVKLRR